jgi:leucyl aminopeptidase
MARRSGLRCQVMDVAELKRRKMGGVLAVGQGSARPPRVIVLEHGRPARKAAGARKQPTFCLVGKGITFDSGGISIKPSASMDEMKHDMGGAAAVIGAMRAIAELKLPLHVVAVIASAENMPDGNAYRPGDVVRSHSGKTIEVLNTDAEGRIVLADALHYAIDKWDPVAVVDLATLTGACQVALGPWASGLLGNDDALIEKVRAAGQASGEPAWPLPLFDAHKQAMTSTIADLKNSGGRFAGASTAAGFLSSFVGDTPWVHLDIAGTGWTSTQGPYQPRGGTGVGVRLVVELLRSWK